MEKWLASLAGWNARLVLDAMHGARWEGGQHESWNSSPPFAWCSGVAAGIGSHGSAIAGADAEERVGTPSRRHRDVWKSGGDVLR